MEKIKITDHQVSCLNSYLFDTNIWMYIYGPIAGSYSYKQKKYSQLLKDIMSRKAGLFVTSLILSEYINRVLRMGFDLWKRNNNHLNADFKHDYRPTEDYKQQLAIVRAQVEDILKVAKKRPDDFHIIDVDNILGTMSSEIDYNDSYILNNSESGNLIIVSDDRDMCSSNKNVRVITS